MNICQYQKEAYIHWFPMSRFGIQCKKLVHQRTHSKLKVVLAVRRFEDWKPVSLCQQILLMHSARYFTVQFKILLSFYPKNRLQIIIRFRQFFLWNECIIKQLDITKGSHKCSLLLCPSQYLIHWILCFCSVFSRTNFFTTLWNYLFRLLHKRI